MTIVVDASALPAILLGEPGGEHAVPYLDDAIISAVNYSETLARAIDRGHPGKMVAELIGQFQIVVVPFQEADGVAAANLRRPTKPKGLSFADRACIALAQRRGCPVLTADRRWSEIELPIEVIQIR